MDVIQFLLCAIGAFYAFAGYVGTRAALTSRFVDCAIAALEGKKPSLVEQVQSYWLLTAATLLFAGGITLLFLLDISAWLFLASAAGQAAYLFYGAPRYFDTDELPDAPARRRSTNAFVIYLVATALVVRELATGELLSWQELGWPQIALPAGAVVAHIVYVVWTIMATPAAPASDFAGFSSHGLNGSGRDPSECTRIKVMADYETYPLWALDEDLFGDFAPEELNLSPKLTRDLNDWAKAFNTSYDPDDPAVSRWSDEERAAHEAKARMLAVRLARERPDRTIFVMDAEVGVVEVRADEEV